MESFRQPHPPSVSSTFRRTKRFWPVLVGVAFVACAPRVTIIDETDDGGAAGMPTGGSTGGAQGGNTSSGGMRASGMAGVGAASGGSAGSPLCYTSGGFGNAVIPCTGDVGVPIPLSCAQPVDGFLPSGCDALAELNHCSKAGCHGALQRAGLLDLTANDYLAARLVNVRVKLRMQLQTRSGSGPLSCVAAACPTDALLIDQQSPEDSWILRKMEDFIPGVTTSTLDIGCGDAMPTFNTAGTGLYSDASKACLTELFMNVARRGTPCAPVVADVPELSPPCPP